MLADPMNLKRYNVHLLPAEAMLVMAKAKFRLTKDTIPWYSTVPCNELEVYYKQQWWKVARVDLMDQVCTGCGGHKTLDEWIAYYRAKIRFGVRLKEFTDRCRSPVCSHGHRFRIFAVIDSLTDG